MTCTTVDYAIETSGDEQGEHPLAPTLDEAGPPKRRQFEEEALPHLDSLYRVARGLAGDSARAEDGVQETLLKAYRSWHLYQRGTNIRAWLFTILRNTLLREHRRNRRMETVDFAELERTSVFEQVQETDPEGRFFQELVDPEVLRAIRDLPGEFREALLLSDVEGLSQKEVAEVTGVPVGTVKSRLYRARRVLQGRLYGYAVEMGYVRDRASGDPAGGAAVAGAAGGNGGAGVGGGG